MASMEVGHRNYVGLLNLRVIIFRMMFPRFGIRPTVVVVDIHPEGDGVLVAEAVVVVRDHVELRVIGIGVDMTAEIIFQNRIREEYNVIVVGCMVIMLMTAGKNLRVTWLWLNLLLEVQQKFWLLRQAVLIQRRIRKRIIRKKMFLQ